ncbi:MAG: DUF2254 domain-containing protein [Nocardioides sp.]|nr:DUF2254 domain-containing protein [Nocardioides sp.]
MARTGTGDYLRGALWVMPVGSVALALVVGASLTAVDIGPSSPLDPFLFQGTSDDARNLLIGISGTMMTVIAVVLGLTLVALQLSSTQFSPRLLRFFLRDRVNQLTLSVFVATFVYATAGLYTVGVRNGQRTDTYPRLAVTLAVVLVFASLVVLVYFVHHISHSIQIDEIMLGVEQNTLRVIEHDLPTTGVTQVPVPEPPVWAVSVPAYTSGYVQTMRTSWLLQIATENNFVCTVGPMVGEHVIKDQPMVWLWRTSPEEVPPDPAAFAGFVHDSVRIGYERTAEQDVAFGIRQLADIAVKALSPAVNDPYTAMQALEHLADVLAALAPRPLGNLHLYDVHGRLRVGVPGRDFAYYVDLATGQIRRYGCTEPRVLGALVKVLGTLGPFCRDDVTRGVLVSNLALVREAAEHSIAQEGDRHPILQQAGAVLGRLSG